MTNDKDKNIRNGSLTEVAIKHDIEDQNNKTVLITVNTFTLH